MHSRPVYEFGPFRLEPDEGLLLREGHPIHVTPKALDLLVFLVGRAGHVVTKDELLKQVWPDTFVEEANLSYTVSLLRRALGDEAHPRRYIETMLRRGYRFVAPVTTPEATPETTAETTAAEDAAERMAPATDPVPVPGGLDVAAIVTRVIDELAPHLSSNERARLGRPGTTRREAFDAYLRARAYASRPSRHDLGRALELFRQAITADPEYAEAWAGLAQTYRALPLTSDADPREVFPEAKRAAARALAIDADSAEGHAALGGITFRFAWDWREAEGLMRRAVTLQPSSARSHLYLASLLSCLGRAEEALTEARCARQLDPLWHSARAREGQFLFFARRYEEALEALETAVELEPAFWNAYLTRALPLIELGQLEKALTDCDRAFELSGGTLWASALRGYALARLGRRAEAEAVRDGLERLASERYVPPHHLALLRHALGDRAGAIAALEQALDARDVFLTFLGVDPKWDDLREEPAFQHLLQRANLLAISRRTAARWLPRPQSSVSRYATRLWSSSSESASA